MHAHGTHTHAYTCTRCSLVTHFYFILSLLITRAHRFVLPPGSSQLKYYKSENDQMNGKDALGALETQGATIFLKEVSQKGIHRFTVRTSQRELKLRATSNTEYEQWIEALRPYAAGFMAEGPDESSRMAEEFDEDDSD